MFVAPLKNNIQSALIILLLTGFALWGSSFMFSNAPIALPVEDEHILFNLLFYKKFSFLSTKFVCLFSILLGAFFVNFLTIHHEISSKTNYLPAFLYIIFAFASSTQQNSEPILIANSMLLPAIYFLINGYKQDEALSSFFKAGLFLGLASFFYMYYIILFPIAFIALLILRAFNWREWVILLMGLLSPLYFYITINYLNNTNALGAFELLKNNITQIQKPLVSEYYLVFFSVTVFIVILAILHYFNKGFGNKIKTIKTKYVLLWLLFLSVFVMFYKQTTDMIFLPCIIPFSIIMGDYLSEIKQLKIANTLLFLFIGGFVIIYCHALGLF